LHQFPIAISLRGLSFTFLSFPCLPAGRERSEESDATEITDSSPASRDPRLHDAVGQEKDKQKRVPIGQREKKTGSYFLQTLPFFIIPCLTVGQA